MIIKIFTFILFIKYIFLEKTNIILPKEFNWVENGVLNEIGNQGECGACVVFSSVAIVESYIKIHTKKLYKLSKQQILDCYFNDICSNGAMMTNIFYYIKDNGLMLDNDYPYTSFEKSFRYPDTKCLYDKNKVVGKIEKFHEVRNIKSNKLKEIIYNYGPVGAVVNSACKDFLDYNGTYILNYNSIECNPDDYDHQIVIVGWGVDNNNNEFWIIRNSWGEEWGKNGYGYIKSGNNVMGIETVINYLEKEEKTEEEEDDSSSFEYSYSSSSSYFSSSSSSSSFSSFSIEDKTEFLNTYKYYNIILYLFIFINF